MQKTIDIYLDPKAEKLLEKLPKSLQKKFIKQVSFLKKNPQHPSLHFKKIKDYWSIRIDDNFRALAYNYDDTILIIWIGSHKDYDKKIRK